MLQPGEIVGRYRVERVLGQGGAAIVYGVRHTVLGTLHALKVLQVIHPDLRARLLEEGRIQAQLRHPNVVPVHDVLTIRDSPALLMDFVGGGSLAKRMERDAPARSEGLRLFRGVVAGVAAAHKEGITHRDLHPGNVLIELGQDNSPDTARVTDFGIAQVLGQTGKRRTQTGVGMGTPVYMAPEQASDASQVDARADMFSLGVILFELMTGQLPFDSSDPVAAMIAARAGDWLDPSTLSPDLPPPIAAAIRGCLQPVPSARIESCDALLAVLSSTTDEGEAHAEASAQPIAVQPSAPRSAPVVAAPPAPDSAQHGAAKALVVDAAGRGHVVDVSVRLQPGTGRAMAPEGVERDARVAAQLAMAAGLGVEAHGWDLWWTVSPAGTRLHGTSVGLAIAVATKAASMNRDAPEGWAFTGGVELDGTVSAVSGVPAKVRAAVESQIAHVAIPDGNQSPSLVGDGDTKVRPIGSLNELWSLGVLGTRGERWWRWRSLGALIIPTLIAMFSFLAPVESWLGHAVVSMTRGPVALDDVAILAVDVPDPKALRSEHAETLRALADAGVRGVIFDLAFSTETTHDESIAAAMRDLSARSVPVVLPARFRFDGLSLPTEPLRSAASGIGIVEARRDTLLNVVRAVPVRRASTTDGVLWNSAVLTAAALQRPDDPPDPRIDDGALIVGSLRNPVWAGLLFLPPLGQPLVVPYGDTERYSELSERTVLIGAFGGSEDIHLTPGGRRYGVELLAGTTQVLLRQAGLRRVSPETDALVTLLTGIGTALLAGLLPTVRRRVALVIPVAVFSVGVALSVAGLLIGYLPMLLAAGVGLWAARRAR